MGKKEKGKKKGLGKAKTLEKTAKKESKRAQKAKEQSGEQDVEDMLAEILAKEEALLAIEEFADVEAPSARINFSVVAHPLKDGEMILFGGEKFDGTTTVFYSDLYRFVPEKLQWTRYRSRNQPPPRSAHAATVHRSFMYIFGGEFSSPRQTQFYHYRDLWRLDTNDFSWEKLDVRGGPTARSGHRMAVCRDKLFVFGGFFDTGSDTRYLNDLFFIDLSLDDLKWVKVEVPGACPSPRSGFWWTSTGEDIVLYGGYCKETVKTAKTLSHKDKKRLAASGSDPLADDAAVSRGIVHSDLWRLDPELKKWEKMKRSGYGPTNRSGFSMVYYKQQLVVFGGVEDEDTEESLSSKFYNDIFAYNIARRKWYPMTLRKKRRGGGARRRRRRAGKDGNGNRDSEAAAAAAAAAPAKRGKDVEDVEMDEPEETTEEAVEEDEDGEEDMDIEEEEEEEEDDAKPKGRINAGLVLLKGSKMYIVGGMYEKGDQEITLDDIWYVDVGKLDEYVPLKKPSASCLEWEASGSEGEEDDEDDEDDEEVERMEEDDGENDAEDDEDEEERREKERLKQKRKSNLQKKLQAEDDLWTPRVGETLKEFYERTKLHWMQEVYEATEETGKANRRISFQWSRKRFDEIKPTLKELEEIEEFFKEEKEAEERHAKMEADMRRLKNRR